jgi:hypothetical protein
MKTNQSTTPEKMLMMLQQHFAQLLHLSDQLRFTVHQIFNFHGCPKLTKDQNFSTMLP